MDNKRLLKNIGVSMLMKPISMVLSFIYIPMALSFLGQEKYGVWVIILNIISWINYFDIGIGNGLRNKLVETITKNDEKSAKEFVSTAYIGASIISVLFCIIIIVVWNTANLSDFFNLSLSDEKIDLIVAISVLFVCINFVIALSKTSAYAIQQPGIISVVGVVGQLLQIGMLFVISHFMRQNLFAIALVYGVICLLESTIIYFIVTYKREYLRPNLLTAKMNLMKPLLTMGLSFFVLQICSLVLNTTDNLLIANLYGSAEVTPYSIVYKFFYIIVQIHAIIIMPMWSAYTEAATREDITWIKANMKKINIVTLAFTIVCIGGIFVFEPIAAIWLGRKLEYGNLLIVSIAIYMVVQMFANNYSSFLCGVGCIKVATITSAIGAIINLPLSIFFAKYCELRLTGIIMGSLCVVLISIVVLPLVARKWIRVKEMEWSLNEKFI